MCYGYQTWWYELDNHVHFSLHKHVILPINKSPGHYIQNRDIMTLNFTVTRLSRNGAEFVALTTGKQSWEKAVYEATAHLFILNYFALHIISNIKLVLHILNSGLFI